MMKQLSWKGVYPAVTTNFLENGELDLPGFGHSLMAQIEAGVHGIIIGGSLGESSTLHHDERIEFLGVAKDIAAKRIPILVNIAEGSTRQAIVLAQRAEISGADGLMLLPPMMYKPTDKEVIRFFSDVAESTSLPILVYNNPVDYKIEVTPAMFDELLKHDNIQAVKESTRDNSNVTRLINRFGERLKILSGVDTIALDALILGAHGWVAGLVNAFPVETVAVYKLIQERKFAEAIAIHRWFLPLLELDVHPQLVQNIKLAQSMTGLGTEYVRPPRQMLEGQIREHALEVIKRSIATRPALS